MSNITPITPSYVFGYWRPWQENSNLFDSYLDYVKDISLVKYGADTVNKYINQASQDQVKAINHTSKQQIEAINQLGQAIGRGINILSNQMSDINESLLFLNRNVDIQIEQQKVSNILLQNIAELLRVPDSEKERQHCIEMGMKFFVNGSKDVDLYADALENLLKAESLMKQDYFVLHRIGCIYLYVEKFINPQKALDYFHRAAKYASVESDSSAARLANVLTNNFNSANSEMSDIQQIGLIAADSFEKASFSAYVLGRFSESVNYQSTALQFKNTPQNRFLLAKYQIRNGQVVEGVKNLDKCIDDLPVLALACFKEIDLINEPSVLNLIAEKNKLIDNSISNLLNKWRNIESTEARRAILELTQVTLLSSKISYEEKVSVFRKYEKKAHELNINIGAIASEIETYIEELNKTAFCSLDVKAIQGIIDELNKAKDMPIEEMQLIIERVKKQIDADKLKIGSKYAGGIVFYIDDSGYHGLVCTEKDLGVAVWGAVGNVGAKENGVGDGSGMRNTKLIASKACFEEKITSKKGLWSTKEVVEKYKLKSAAELCLECNHNGYSDWHLPTLKELELIYKNIANKGLISDDDCNYFYWSSFEHTDEFANYYRFSQKCIDGMSRCSREMLDMSDSLKMDQAQLAEIDKLAQKRPLPDSLAQVRTLILQRIEKYGTPEPCCRNSNMHKLNNISGHVRAVRAF